MIDYVTIQKILDTADIVEVVQDFVPLKKRGVNYLGLCPFHNEKTPSFTVSPSKGIFKCFGCGKAGNAVNFIMEHEKLSYPDALRYLAKKYHIEIVEKERTEEDNAKQNERESLLVLSNYAAQQFTNNLFNTEDGVAIGLSYFKGRGFRQDTLKKFEVGYCIDARDVFTKKALSDGYNKDFLIKTGLSVEGQNGLFDRFRGRVMFPIHSVSGQVIAFGGRVLQKTEKTAKYLNSPESEVYHKSRILYGIYQARKAIGVQDKCFLVEGYTDVMSLHEAGIENVVASSGTSLTVEQVRLIKRFTPNVTILYDGDFAGIKASLRGINIVLEEGLNVKTVLLPEGEDPDSYSKKLSNEAFLKYLKDNETDFIKFKSNLLMKDVENDPMGKVNVINDIVKTISVIPDSIARTVYIKECSKLMDVAENILFQEVDNVRRNNWEKEKQRYENKEKEAIAQHKPQNTAIVQSEYLESEKEVIRLLIKYGKEPYESTQEGGNITIADFIVNQIVSDGLSFDYKTFNDIFKEFIFATQQGEFIEESHFTNNSDPDISKIAAELLIEKHTLSKIWSIKHAYSEDEQNKLPQLVDESVMKFKSDKLTKMIKEVEEEMKKASEEKDEQKLTELLKKDFELKKIKNYISKNLGNRIIL